MFLVVDDNALVRDLIRHILDVRQDVEVEFADSGEDAVLLASTKIYSLILMDLNLDGICGVEAAIRIRALPWPHNEQPIMALTGLTPVPGMAKWEYAKFEEPSLVKPFSVDQLMAIIDKYEPGKDPPNYAI